MAERMSRAALHELVWANPIHRLAERFEISDVALKKTCENAAVPTPPRGYWAQLAANRRVLKTALPPRPPGMNDIVRIAAGRHYWDHGWSQEELNAPLPPEPVFDESLESVRARIEKSLGPVKVPRDVQHWHPVIQRYLTADAERRTKQLASMYPTSWDAPLFDSPFERRRFRVLNALFMAAARLRGRATLQAYDARDVSITFYQQTVSLTLDRPNPVRRERYGLDPKQGFDADTRLVATTKGRWGEAALATWHDDDGALKVEPPKSRLKSLSQLKSSTGKVRSDTTNG